MYRQILAQADDRSEAGWIPIPLAPAPIVVTLGALPALAFSDADGAPATILAGGITAALVLPILGRALNRLPEWGIRVVRWREEARNSRRQQRVTRRTACVDDADREGDPIQELDNCSP